MNSCKYKNNLAVLLVEGKTIVTLSDKSKYLFRVFGVNMVLASFSASKIGSMVGVLKATITKWVKTVDEKD